MQSDITKACADYLRSSFTTEDTKLKSAHAHELTAAFFGYSSRAALLSDLSYPIERLKEAQVLIPDMALIEQRILQLEGLPQDAANAENLAHLLAFFLQDEGYFSGDAWGIESLEDHIYGSYLPEHQAVVEKLLSNLSVSHKVAFSSLAFYDRLNRKLEEERMIITITGELPEEPVAGKAFKWRALDICIDITFPRVAGKTSFLNPKISVREDIHRDLLH